MPQALPYIMIGGSALSAFGQIQQGNAANEAAQANARLAMQEGAAKREALKYEGLKLSREQNATIEQQKALYGASGVDMSTGSPLDVMANTAAQYSRDIGMTGIAADQAYSNAENQAEIYRYQGKQAKMGGYLGAGGTLLTGIANAYGMSQGYGKYGGYKYA